MKKEGTTTKKKKMENKQKVAEVNHKFWYSQTYKTFSVWWCSPNQTTARNIVSVSFPMSDGCRL